MTQQPKTSRIAELTQIIQANTAKLDERTKALDTESVSIDHGVSQKLQEDLEASEARRIIAESAAEMQALVQGAESLLSAPPVFCTSLECPHI